MGKGRSPQELLSAARRFFDFTTEIAYAQFFNLDPQAVNQVPSLAERKQQEQASLAEKIRIAKEHVKLLSDIIPLVYREKKGGETFTPQYTLAVISGFVENPHRLRPKQISPYPVLQSLAAHLQFIEDESLYQQAVGLLGKYAPELLPPEEQQAFLR